VVLLDVHMPVMNGPETLKRLRASDAPWSTVPVVALTADALAGDREKYLGMGMNAYLSKPIDQSELLAAIAAMLELAAETEGEGGMEEPLEMRKATAGAG
jgi:CheY-like chemotaxis protein